jgi:hypothetical protein
MLGISISFQSSLQQGILTEEEDRQLLILLSVPKTCGFFLETMLAVLGTQPLYLPNWGVVVDDLTQASVASFPCSKET